MTIKTYVSSTYNIERIVTSGLQFEIVASWLTFLEVPVHYRST